MGCNVDRAKRIGPPKLARVAPRGTTSRLFSIGGLLHLSSTPHIAMSTIQTASPHLRVSAAKGSAPSKEPPSTRISPPETSSVEDHFFWTYTEEPHRSRRQAIIKAHPEVRCIRFYQNFTWNYCSSFPALVKSLFLALPCSWIIANPGYRIPRLPSFADLNLSPNMSSSASLQLKSPVHTFSVILPSSTGGSWPQPTSSEPPPTRTSSWQFTRSPII